MKKWLIITGLLLSLLLAGSTACGQLGGGKETTDQLVEVVRGDLAITVSGSGTIEVSHDMDLTFGVAGRIDKLFFEEGDEVKEEDILASLETDALVLALVQAKVTYAQAQVAVTQYEVAMAQAGVAITQAEISLKSAEIALEQTIKTSSVSDIRIAQAELDTAQRNLTDSILTLGKYSLGSIGYEEYQKNVLLAQARLKASQDRLDAMLGGFSTDEVAVKQQQVTAATQALATARQSLELTKLTVELGHQSLEAAGQARDYAQRQLDKATLLVPFTGTIASLPVDERDTVLATTTIARLIEPDKMELKVQVDEIDIPGVKPGQRAIIKVDALPEIDLEGKVSYISLLPKKEGGVTLFEVKIELDATDNTGLRSGMSASADIVTEERSDVLLVPIRVVKQNSQGDSIVEVSVSGQIQERTVVTGISDGFQIEIVSGLEEGEKVVEKRAQ